MATKKRIIIENVPYHVTTRLVNREVWFNLARALRNKKGKKVYELSPLSLNKLKVVDRRRIIKVLKKIVVFMDKKYGFKIYHFVLMDTHYHIICETTNSKYKLDRCMQVFNMMIAKKVNKLIGRSGHLFGSRYQSNAILDEKYGKMVLGYIYANPVVAGLVREPFEHDCTSYRCYILTSNKSFPVDMECPILDGEINHDGEDDSGKDCNDGLKKGSKGNGSRKELMKKRGRALKGIVEGYLHDKLGMSKSEFRERLRSQVLVSRESFERLSDKVKRMILSVEKGFL